MGLGICRDSKSFGGGVGWSYQCYLSNVLCYLENVFVSYRLFRLWGSPVPNLPPNLLGPTLAQPGVRFEAPATIDLHVHRRTPLEA